MNSFAMNWTRALRLPFISASALPFIFGSLVDAHNFNLPACLFGLIAALSMHLSANLMNDYADSRSRADWQDRRFYGFFGGSKLIQEGAVTERSYLKAAVFFAIICACAIAALAIILRNIFVIYIFLVIVFLAWSYSAKPLQFSYNRLGEIVIFILFGPALVMGGYFLQTGRFADLKIFTLSVPFGLLTTAILYANEIPDLQDDKRAGKLTWVSLVGEARAYILYSVLAACAFLSIILNVACGFLNPAALFSLSAIFLAVRAAMILKEYPADKMRLVESSRLTVLLQAVTSSILILGVIL